MQEHVLPYYEEYTSRRIPQPGDPDYEEPQHTHHPDSPHPNPSDNPSDVPSPNHDPGNHDIDSADLGDELINSSSAARNPSADNNSCASRRVTKKALFSNHSKGRTTPGDSNHIVSKDNARIERMSSSSQDYHPRNIRKVNSNLLLDSSRPRKVTSTLWDQRHWKKPNSQQEYHRGILKPLNESPNPSSQASVLPSPSDPSTSDDEDDELIASSDSDVDDFELETLSQAVQKSVSHGRRK